ncbi:hypothetical protein [Kocuria sp.]|uniref:hypothetical protein n=1 Tax=Kocuria sp. TaxID=1871328 RepID=UPI0028127739|nr:hypothetical protein [Kocuria sp.]
MRTLVATLLVAALVMTSAGALLTSVGVGEWLPVVLLAGLAYLGTFHLYRRWRQKLDRPED